VVIEEVSTDNIKSTPIKENGNVNLYTTPNQTPINSPVYETSKPKLGSSSPYLDIPCSIFKGIPELSGIDQKKLTLEQLDQVDTQIKQRHQKELDELRESKLAMAQRHREEIAALQQPNPQQKCNFDPLSWKYLNQFTERSIPKPTPAVPITQPVQFSQPYTTEYSLSAPSSIQNFNSSNPLFNNKQL